MYYDDVAMYLKRGTIKNSIKHGGKRTKKEKMRRQTERSLTVFKIFNMLWEL